jgi:hypothetical protein
MQNGTYRKGSREDLRVTLGSRERRERRGERDER